MNNKSTQKLIHSAGLISTSSQKIVNCVNTLMSVSQTISFKDAIDFQSWLGTIKLEEEQLILYSEWYLDVLYGSSSQEESSRLLTEIVKISGNPNVVVIAICPYGLGQQFMRQIGDSRIKLLEGVVTPMQLVRTFSVQ